MNQIAFQKAIQEISSRRIHAQAENERRCQEINQKIPQISEINRQLSQTVIRILNGENIEAVKRQNLDAQRYCAQLLANHGYPRDYLDLHYTCEKCQDTGYTNNGQYCTCLEKLISSFAIADMNQNAQIKLCSFEHFSLDYYKGHECYSSMAKILAGCKKYATNFNLNSPSMLFYGDVGIGKTHLSLSIVTEVLKQGYAVIYDSVGNLLSKIENEHFKNSNPEKNTLTFLLNVDLLVLDDLGTEFNSSFALSTIYTIINTRITKGLPTIISTNLGIQEITDSYEERITSRLLAIYEPMEFRGVDVRMIKKQMSERIF